MNYSSTFRLFQPDYPWSKCTKYKNSVLKQFSTCQICYWEQNMNNQSYACLTALLQTGLVEVRCWLMQKAGVFPCWQIYISSFWVRSLPRVPARVFLWNCIGVITQNADPSGIFEDRAFVVTNLKPAHILLLHVNIHLIICVCVQCTVDIFIVIIYLYSCHSKSVCLSFI